MKKIAVDLDGTWARYDEWKGHAHIGVPIEAVTAKVVAALKGGYGVIIFTARAASRGALPWVIPTIWMWVEAALAGRVTRQELSNLEISNEKTSDIVEFWDDRAVRISKNYGSAVPESGTIWASLE